MNADKFTQKTIETIQTAQSMAQENGNQYLTPEHLLYALVDADGGLIGTLLGRMGVDCNAVLSELDTAIDQLPKVPGGSGGLVAVVLPLEGNVPAVTPDGEIIRKLENPVAETVRVEIAHALVGDVRRLVQVAVQRP